MDFLKGWLPPEWRSWNWAGRAAYIVTFAAFIFLLGLGAMKLKDLLT